MSSFVRLGIFYSYRTELDPESPEFNSEFHQHIARSKRRDTIIAVGAAFVIAGIIIGGIFVKGGLS